MTITIVLRLFGAGGLLAFGCLAAEQANAGYDGCQPVCASDHTGTFARVMELNGQPGDVSRYVGTWRKDVVDSRSNSTTILTLRQDGAYTKRLTSLVDGRNYGGTHSGTWTANGSQI